MCLVLVPLLLALLLFNVYVLRITQASCDVVAAACMPHHTAHGILLAIVCIQKYKRVRDGSVLQMPSKTARRIGVRLVLFLCDFFPVFVCFLNNIFAVGFCYFIFWTCVITIRDSFCSSSHKLGANNEAEAEEYWKSRNLLLPLFRFNYSFLQVGCTELPNQFYEYYVDVR